MADATLSAPSKSRNPFPLLVALLATALLLPSLASAQTRQAPHASAGVVFRAGASASVGSTRARYYPASGVGPRYDRRPVLRHRRPAYAPARASYAPRSNAHRPHRRLNCRTALAGFVTVCTAGAR